MRSLLRSLSLAFVVLLASGCQSVFFGYVNRDSPPPAVTATYDAGHGLAVDVHLPQGAVTAAPVVVFFYGGAWQRGSRTQYRFVGSRLARHGVVAVIADYRTWPAAGFPDFVDDAARAVRWTRDHVAAHGGDPERIFVAGHSAGAQIAALLGTDRRYLARVGLEPGDLAGVVGLAGPYDFSIGGRLERIFGPREQWPDAMAVRFVDGDEPPFLLIHGDRDRTVEPGNSARLHAALQEAGAPSRIVRLAGASHFAPAAAFYSPGRFPEVLPAILSFVGAHEPMSPRDAESGSRASGGNAGHTPLPARRVAPDIRRSSAAFAMRFHACDAGEAHQATDCRFAVHKAATVCPAQVRYPRNLADLGPRLAAMPDMRSRGG